MATNYTNSLQDFVALRGEMMAGFFRWGRLVIAAALFLSVGGTSAPVWCESPSLWIGFESGGGIESYTSAQLASNGSPSPEELTTFGSVLGLAFDGSNHLWATANRFQLVRFTPKQLNNLGADPSPTPGVVITSSSDLNNMVGCNFDRSGNLWVIDVSNDTLNEISKAQLARGSRDLKPAIVITLSSLSDPNFVTFDQSGNAWIDDIGNDQIAEYAASQLTSDGTKKPRVLLSDDGSGSSLSAPGEILFDDAGNLWVANYNSNTVVKYAAGQLMHSGSPAPKVKLSSTSFNGPYGAAFDPKAKLVIANINDGSIDKFTLDQLKTSGAPTPAVVVTGNQTNDYQITFGPAFERKRCPGSWRCRHGKADP